MDFTCFANPIGHSAKAQVQLPTIFRLFLPQRSIPSIALIGNWHTKCGMSEFHVIWEANFDEPFFDVSHPLSTHFLSPTEKRLFINLNSNELDIRPTVYIQTRVKSKKNQHNNEKLKRKHSVNNKKNSMKVKGLTA